jgi:hypothetical protein
VAEGKVQPHTSQKIQICAELGFFGVKFRICQAGPEFACWVFDGIGLGYQPFLKKIYKN